MTAAEALDPVELGSCGCAKPFGELIAILDGREHTVEPAECPGGADSMFWAYCRRCRARYPGHWRVANPPPRQIPPGQTRPPYKNPAGSRTCGIARSNRNFSISRSPANVMMDPDRAPWTKRSPRGQSRVPS